MEIIDINKYYEDDRSSFHIASEKYFRIQIIKFNKGEIANEYKLKDENLLIVVIDGNIDAIVNNNKYNINNQMKILLTSDESFSIKALDKSVLEFIWSPGLYIFK
jgi:hypothetical protein